MEIENELFVDVSPQRAWDALGGSFGEICRWASGVADSSFEPASVGTLLGGARTCRIEGVGDISERVTAYEPQAFRLAYEIEGMPFPVRSASNEWVVRSESGGSVVSSRLHLSLVPVLGTLISPIVRRQMGRTMSLVLEDFKHFVQYGAAHPRKLATKSGQPAASGA